MPSNGGFRISDADYVPNNVVHLSVFVRFQLIPTKRNGLLLYAEGRQQQQQSMDNSFVSISLDNAYIRIRFVV
jgi:hypothetical protein